MPRKPGQGSKVKGSKVTNQRGMEILRRIVLGNKEEYITRSRYRRLSISALRANSKGQFSMYIFFPMGQS